MTFTRSPPSSCNICQTFQGQNDEWVGLKSQCWLQQPRWCACFHPTWRAHRVTGNVLLDSSSLTKWCLLVRWAWRISVPSYPTCFRYFSCKFKGIHVVRPGPSEVQMAMRHFFRALALLPCSAAFEFDATLPLGTTCHNSAQAAWEGGHAHS
jgi:hypothetical protein